LLLHTNSESTPLFNHLSLLTRKIWSPFLFKKLTSSYAIENYLVEHKVPEVIMNDSRLFYNWLINEMIQEEKSLKGDFIGKLKLNGVKKANKFSLIPIKLPQQSVFRDSLSISIEQYQLEKLLEMKKLRVLSFPTYLTIYIDRKNDLSVDGLENKLNMNIVKYDPDMLLIDGEKYSLVATITYDNKTQVYDKARDIWLEFDGKSLREVEKALLFISNCRFLFWEKRELN
jgi:U4/U6.U5 tri-snRNP-associated protein 2